jgi:hypothetical protein
MGLGSMELWLGWDLSLYKAYDIIKERKDKIENMSESMKESEYLHVG